jgi:hypothetical protein
MHACTHTHTICLTHTQSCRRAHLHHASPHQSRCVPRHSSDGPLCRLWLHRQQCRQAQVPCEAAHCSVPKLSFLTTAATNRPILPAVCEPSSTYINNAHSHMPTHAHTCTYMHIHMHARTHAHTDTHTHICIHTEACMQECTHIQTLTHMRTHARVCRHALCVCT